jgi:hypothetical protein
MDDIVNHGLKLINVMKAAGIGPGQIVRRETIDAMWSKDVVDEFDPNRGRGKGRRHRVSPIPS